MTPQQEAEALELLEAIQQALAEGSTHLRATVATCNRTLARMAGTDERLKIMVDRVERIANYLEGAP